MPGGQGKTAHAYSSLDTGERRWCPPPEVRTGRGFEDGSAARTEGVVEADAIWFEFGTDVGSGPAGFAGVGKEGAKAVVGRRIGAGIGLVGQECGFEGGFGSGKDGLLVRREMNADDAEEGNEARRGGDATGGKAEGLAVPGRRGCVVSAAVEQDQQAQGQQDKPREKSNQKERHGCS